MSSDDGDTSGEEAGQKGVKKQLGQRIGRRAKASFAPNQGLQPLSSRRAGVVRPSLRDPVDFLQTPHILEAAKIERTSLGRTNVPSGRKAGCWRWPRSVEAS